MNTLKGQYEISIWEDVIKYVGVNNNIYDSLEELAQAGTMVNYQFYSEQRLAIIGSDTMTSLTRAINPDLSRNINGVYTLKFDMYYRFVDNETGKIERNPLIDLVIDERKVKLYYPDGGDDQPDHWYDFIVKKDDEKGRENKYSFTCNGLAANELGKTGFNVELNAELKNNMGTVQELGAAVLEGSDWQLAQSGQQVIQQTNDEALYSVILTSEITNAKTLDGEDFTNNIPVGARIYVYYTPWANQEKDYFQFIYVDSDTGTLVPDLYEDKVTIYCNNTRTYDLYLTGVDWENDQPSFATGTPSVSQYRGRRYVRKQLMAYDPVLEKTVYKYNKRNETPAVIYHGYTTTEYISAASVVNFIHNSVNFPNTTYWNLFNGGSLSTRVYPDAKASNLTESRKAYLIANLTSPSSYLYNDGIIHNYTKINRFEVGLKYRLKIKVSTLNDSNLTYLETLPFDCKIEKYELIDSPNNRTTYFTFSGTGTYSSDGFITIDADCTNSTTWRDLKENVGVFFTLNANGVAETDYYIEEIRLFRYIEDENGEVLDINSVPEPQVNTIYHFYNPAINAGFLTVEDYIFDDNDPDKYIALYGSGDKEFEKVRSITTKESNRFNLLQQLAETFQCWVKFKIYHENDGTITVSSYDIYNPIPLEESEFEANTYYIYDQIEKEYVFAAEWNDKKQYFEKVSRLRQKKEVIFYGEILQDNYIGFKYGINLKDNNRTLDSEQIATKIIVKNNSCEQADNGFCSIARAKDNPIKENFALNLDYYITQGLIDAGALNNDLYLKINGSIGLYPRLSELNKERNDLITERAVSANAIDNLKSQQQVYQLEYNESTKDLEELLDPVSGKLVRYTGYIYDDFGNQYKGDNEEISAYANTIYYIKTSGISNIVADAGTITYYKRETASAPEQGRTYYKMSGNQFVLYESNKFIGGFSYYYSVGAQYGEGVYFQTDTNTTSLTFTGSDTPEVYIYDAARRTMNVDGNDFTDDSYTIAMLASVATLTATNEEAYNEYTKYTQNLQKVQAEYDSIQERLADIATATKEVEKEFYTKYSRYIQEGSWIDDNYMDDDLYYLDALSVLYQSAYPKVTYSFTPLDLKYLEGYEDFDFQVAHKTYVEDVEMFGYRIVDNLRTPVRETVVVTELTQNLDDPTKNQIKIQNYKSHFEDLFQRITAATQSLEYHSGEYAKAAGAMTTEGEISQDTMQRSLANAAYVIQNSRDQSVVWDETGLQATKLNDPLQITRLTSSGLIVSADGGQTWGVAISGYGINTNYLSAGTIDADKINILSGAYPTFKWDANGLRAYGFTKSGDTITSFDPTTFVGYDKFGIYGIKDSLNPVFTSLNDVEDNANFALTWNGLFMRSQHINGYVRISPTEDIVLYETVEGDSSSIDILRGKFGALSDEIYGIALYDLNGNPTVTTQSNGTLWLQNSMKIGKPNQTNTIYVGVGENDPGDQNRYKVFKVNDSEDVENFVVYSDGSMYAANANITGTITATDGEFSGIIHARDGEFSGIIYAKGGRFDDVIQVGNESVYIGNGPEDQEENARRIINVNYNNDDQFIVFSNGKIKAKNADITGTIHATDGEFEGTIIATSGTIGGFNIGENTISTDGLILQSQYIDENNQTVPSKITVANIDIGSGANITDYLQIGNLKLLKPTQANDNNVLTLIENNTNYFSLNNNGNIDGQNWSIKKENNDDYVTARFGRLVAENGEFKGTISASTINASTFNVVNFVTQKIRAMGGSFIFRPTFNIENINKISNHQIEFTLDNSSIDYLNIDLSQGQIYVVGISGTDLRFGNVISTNSNVITIELTETDYNAINDDYNVLILFGYSNQDIIIGINSDESTSILPPRSLVMEEFERNNNGFNQTIKLLLGDLTGQNLPITGYGLYAENVYLRGSLVTESLANSYAGVNTEGPVSFDYNVWSGSTGSNLYQNDKIIFWGGAPSASDTDIQKSPFIVTDKGNIFARSGEFKGSVISDSTIANSIIKAPIIYGTGSNPSLKIYDTGANGGIGFYQKINSIDEGNENDDVLTLSIDITGFTYKTNNQFIEFNNNNVIANLSLANFGDTSITEHQISNGNNSKITINNTELKNSYGLNEIIVKDDSIINTVTDNSTIMNKGTVIITDDVNLTGKSLKYMKKGNYYVLYVS